MILGGCGAVGFKMAADHRKEIRTLRACMRALEHMSSELSFRVTPLPQLCRAVANEQHGTIRSVFMAMAEELDAQILPDASRCMKAALQRIRDVPEHTGACLQILGETLGYFDLEGQLVGLETALQACKEHLRQLENNKDVRLRSYQTLGLCAGAALAILLM